MRHSALLLAVACVQCSHGSAGASPAVEAEVLARVTRDCWSVSPGGFLPLMPHYNGARMVEFAAIERAHSYAAIFIEQHFGPGALDAVRKQLRSGAGRSIPHEHILAAGQSLNAAIPTTSDEGQPHYSVSRLYWREDLDKGLIYVENMSNPSEGSGWLVLVAGTIGKLDLVGESPVFF